MADYLSVGNYKWVEFGYADMTVHGFRCFLLAEYLCCCFLLYRIVVLCHIVCFTVLHISSLFAADDTVEPKN